MSETTQSQELSGATIFLPLDTEEDRRYKKRIKKILGVSILFGAIVGGAVGWLDGLKSEKHTNESMQEEADGLRRCAKYISTLDLGKNSLVRVKSLPPRVRQDCGLGYVPLKITDGLGNSVGAAGTSGGFEEAASDTVLQYSEQNLASEIYRLERDAQDEALGYSVVEGIGGIVGGGVIGFLGASLIIIGGEVRSYRHRPDPQSAMQ